MRSYETRLSNTCEDKKEPFARFFHASYVERGKEQNDDWSPAKFSAVILSFAFFAFEEKIDNETQKGRKKEEMLIYAKGSREKGKKNRIKHRVGTLIFWYR